MLILNRLNESKRRKMQFVILDQEKRFKYNRESRPITIEDSGDSEPLDIKV